MLVRRTAQLRLLEEQYSLAGNNLVILYGRSGLGKTTLIKEFMEGKPTYYYAAMEGTAALQLSLMEMKWLKPANTDSYVNTKETTVPGYSELLLRLTKQEEKQIIVIDEFHYLMKNYSDFAQDLQLLLSQSSSVMVLLCSSSIRFIENDMVAALGETATAITAYLKLKEFTFVDFVNRFPNTSIEHCIYIKALFGGIPGYLSEWNEKASVKENILHLLNKDHKLLLEPQLFLKQELRETAVYNTILYAIAQGNRKLNDLHHITGFSRAKIIVYIKHLMELDLVEKLVPLGEEGKANAKKGLYRIRDNFFHFWFRFIFPHFSELMEGGALAVYDNEIQPYLNEYVGEYFADVCTEYLRLMNQHKRFEGDYKWWDRWYGKNGTIDILAQGEDELSLVGKCLWQERRMTAEDYYKLLALSEEAGIRPKEVYLFSKNGFEEDLHSLAQEGLSIVLTELADL